jgi:alpha-mannosidase
MGGGHEKEVESYLPTELSFLEIDNKNILLSILKKAEIEDHLIIRCYNISAVKQLASLKLFEGFSIKNMEIVNLLEEKYLNEIKASLQLVSPNKIELTLEPHVIVTLKLVIENQNK